MTLSEIEAAKGGNLEKFQAVCVNPPSNLSIKENVFVANRRASRRSTGPGTKYAIRVKSVAKAIRLPGTASRDTETYINVAHGFVDFDNAAASLEWALSVLLTKLPGVGKEAERE
jgi:hypothetical protein